MLPRDLLSQGCRSQQGPQPALGQGAPAEAAEQVRKEGNKNSVLTPEKSGVKLIYMEGKKGEAS